MFELELINLLNQYKKSSDYEKEKIEESISKLITQHHDEYNLFIQKQNSNLSSEITSLLKKCENEKEEKNENASNKSDYEIIKEQYQKWLKIFQNNNNIPNSNNETIIVNLINHYAPSNLEILKKILNINDSEEYEKFKNMLKNYLRKYYSEKIKNFYISENFNQKKFFEKRKIKNQLIKILEEIGEYKFDEKKIKEVIQ